MSYAIKYATTVVSAALLAGAAGTAAAQPQQGEAYSPPSPAQQRGQAQVSDQQLQQFVTAMEEVRSVQEEFSAAIQEADDMDEAQTLRADAQEEMRGAVEDTGLSVAEYNMIAQRLQSDPNLSARLQEMQQP